MTSTVPGSGRRFSALFSVVVAVVFEAIQSGSNPLSSHWQRVASVRCAMVAVAPVVVAPPVEMTFDCMASLVAVELVALRLVELVDHHWSVGTIGPVRG